MSSKRKPNPRKRRGSLQVRDGKSGHDRRWWSPERDLTVLLPSLVREVFYDLDAEFDSWNPEWKQVLNSLGITRDEIMQAARTYAKIVRCVLARGEDLRNALHISGFGTNRVNALIGMLVLEKLTTRFVEAYGTTLHRGEIDPNHEDLKECLEMLESFDESEN